MCLYEGREFESDTARLIHKFDIYFCDLGDIGETNTLGKTRPCVIVSSDDINDPRSGQYMIAPMRTEHGVEATADNIEDIVAEKYKLGRIYVPVLMSPSDGYRFIDITQMRQIPSSSILNYKGSIINPNVRERINTSLMKLLFSKDEFTITETVEDVEPVVYHELEDKSTVEESSEIPVEAKEIEEPKKKKSKRKSSFPMGFSKYFQLYQKGEMTIAQVAEKLNSPRTTVYYQIKRYAELHPELVTSK